MFCPLQVKPTDGVSDEQLADIAVTWPLQHHDSINCNECFRTHVVSAFFFTVSQLQAALREEMIRTKGDMTAVKAMHVPCMH